MLFMNEFEVLSAARQYQDDPVLGPATRTLYNLMNWTNSNSDGWPYWAKPVRAAARLQELIQAQQGIDRDFRYDSESNSKGVTVAEYRKALMPVKAFRTRQNANFEIVEVN